jgi:hypothetical protein
MIEASHGWNLLVTVVVPGLARASTSLPRGDIKTWMAGSADKWTQSRKLDCDARYDGNRISNKEKIVGRFKQDYYRGKFDPL